MNLAVGLLILSLDIAAIAGLLMAIVVVALLRPSQIARRSAPLRRWMGLGALVAALGLVVLANVMAVRFVISSDNQGRPAQSQVVGTWIDRHGAKVQVRADGTFVAAGLPTDSNDPAGDGKPHPAGGHGRWQIVRGDGTWYVALTLSGGSQFQFWGLEVSRAGAGTAWFSWVFPQFNAVNIWEFYRR